MGGWLAVSVIILPLRGPSCKLRLARFSAELWQNARKKAIKSKSLQIEVFAAGLSRIQDKTKQKKNPVMMGGQEI